jgi:hypothetical protein
MGAVMKALHAKQGRSRLMAKLLSAEVQNN